MTKTGLPVAPKVCMEYQTKHWDKPAASISLRFFKSDCGCWVLIFFSEGHKNCRSINHTYFWCYVEPGFDHGCSLNKASRIPSLDVTAGLLSHANIFLVNLYLFYLPYLRHYKPQFIFLKMISLFSSLFYFKILSLVCTVSIQEWFVIKSGSD